MPKCTSNEQLGALPSTRALYAQFNLPNCLLTHLDLSLLQVEGAHHDYVIAGLLLYTLFLFSWLINRRLASRTHYSTTNTSKPKPLSCVVVSVRDASLRLRGHEKKNKLQSVCYLCYDVVVRVMMGMGVVVVVMKRNNFIIIIHISSCSIHLFSVLLFKFKTNNLTLSKRKIRDFYFSFRHPRTLS